MPVQAKPIPNGYHVVTPYLIVHDGAGALTFYANAFGARETMRIPGPGGRTAHAEMTVGDSVLMLADDHPEMEALSPKTVGGTSVGLLLYVDDRAREARQGVWRRLTNATRGRRPRPQSGRSPERVNRWPKCIRTLSQSRPERAARSRASAGVKPLRTESGPSALT